ncbi:hypothetical protein BV53_03240 [Candidatus Synechococcus spongiarum LMB bulk15N]|uniref:Restriction endonuclease n=2 Tax=Candidatus Synechococcus spongiarum TaxID=431041 RepID=A0A1T1D496_9SYNE|nr:hypothetical protein BV53_03240 [Candidatus Synechococcus spongiarum LMB bulk15N]
MDSSLELQACHPQPVDIESFNPAARLPYGLTIEHLCTAMNSCIHFIGFVNQQLHGRSIPRLETILMSATFSSMIGEFMASTIPKHCRTIAKNGYHNGHPDLVPKEMFPNDTVQYAREGIEVKSSRYLRGWQGHNAENVWLMVFCFASNRPNDKEKDISPFPFRYLGVFGARLEKADWTFSGRSTTSRRTITASVNRSGHAKMVDNWIYRNPSPKL